MKLSCLLLEILSSWGDGEDEEGVKLGMSEKGEKAAAARQQEQQGQV